MFTCFGQSEQRVNVSVFYVFVDMVDKVFIINQQHRLIYNIKIILVSFIQKFLSDYRLTRQFAVRLEEAMSGVR